MEENKFEENFTNEQVFSATLPRIEDVQYEPIPKPALYVNFIVIGVIFMIILLIASLVVIFVEDAAPYSLPVLGGILMLFGFIFYAEHKAFSFRGFALREHDIMFRSGWLWKSTIIIPYSRVQHIELNQGPIDKLFDLATITIFTAGGSSSDLEIDGLGPDQAANVKAFIIARSNTVLHTDESE